MLKEGAAVIAPPKVGPSVVLEEALKLIEDEDSWLQGEEDCVNPDGSMSFCAVGAVWRAYANNFDAWGHPEEHVREDAIQALGDEVRELVGDNPSYIGESLSVVTLYNDDDRREHREVVALFRNAIERAKS